MKSLTQFDSLYMADESERGLLSAEVTKRFEEIGTGFLVLIALFAADVWDIWQYLPDDYQHYFRILVRPIGLLIAVFWIGFGMDEDRVREKESPGGSSAGVILRLIQVPLYFIEFATLIGLVLLTWDLGVTLAGFDWWTSAMIGWEDRELWINFSLHTIMWGNLMMLLAPLRPGAALVFGIVTLPLALYLSMIRTVVDLGVDSALQLASVPGISPLADLVSDEGGAEGLLYAAGLVYLGFIMLAQLFRSVIQVQFDSHVETLAARAENAGVRHRLPSDGEFAPIGNFSNIYRVVDLNNYEYFSARD